MYGKNEETGGPCVAPHMDLDTPILTSSLLPVLFRNKE